MSLPSPPPMPTEPLLSDDAEEATVTIVQWVAWVPFVLTTFFVATLPILHLWISSKVRLLPASVLAKLVGDPGRAYSAWAWMNAHRVAGWAYCVALVIAGYLVGRVARKRWALLLLLAGLLLPALWYWNQASYLAEQLLLKNVR